MPLSTVVKDIKAKNAKVLFSVGGWSYSRYFSAVMSDSTKQDKFVAGIEGFIDEYELDGIDIDWEFPGRLGLSCNTIDEANDTPNFLKFIQKLRTSLDDKYGKGKKLITMAVRVQPFDINGVPSDVTEFGKLVDFANIMAYDINGGWSKTTGPNAPLNNESGKGDAFSVATAIDEWTGKGWPANKLTLGIAFYGRSTSPTVDMTLDPDNQYQSQSLPVPNGDNEDAPWSDSCGTSAVLSGTWRWVHLRDQGILTKPNTAASPWIRKVDPISQTPWLYNPDTKRFISYDDVDSIKAKVDYAASKGLAGTMVWSMDMDYNDELLDVLHTWKAPASGARTDAIKSSGESDEDNEKCDDEEEGPVNYSTSTNTSSDSSDDEEKCDDDNEYDVGEDGGVVDSPNNAGGANVGTAAGGSCSDGEYQCSQAEGTGTGYRVCDHGQWVSMACGTGTVCKKVEGTLLCGWP
ncbi:hypothetical protein H4R99_003147 [Coemansia sp. RSA 1722]|nr:hypothetical protein IWW45_005154 [Coemansia sp. RSA 485]KAJ2600824.1 hypothetical protein GGF39_001588 [Coemansia sp. RSA 1721]KAJ2600977.1 hypothetical protein H4R99_003147 [Coemansia sp. RSA 1722]